MLNDMHCANAGQPLGCAGVDGDDAAVGNRGIHHARVEHARADARPRCTCRAHRLRRPVVAHGRLADVHELRVWSQRRWLVEQNVPLLVFQAILRDAEDKIFAALGWLCGFCGSARRSMYRVHPMPPFRWPALPGRRAAGQHPGSPQRLSDRFRSGTGCRSLRASRRSRFGFGLRSSRAAQLITMPGVQKPHCMASCFTKAAWTGCIVSPWDRPSMVVIWRPMVSIDKVMQASAGVLSIQTVHAEQEPRSQTTLVPVSPMLSRRVWARVSRGSMTTECSRPLMCSLTGRASGPCTRLECMASLASRARAFAVSMTEVAAVTPAPFKKPRRENVILEESGESAIGAFRMLARFQIVDPPEAGAQATAVGQTPRYPYFTSGGRAPPLREGLGTGGV